jgi:hypothetical protein
MKDRQYTDQQFSHILDVLIQYKRCCPEKDVYLNESSIQEAFTYFMKTGIFEGSPQDGPSDSDSDE